MGVFPNSIAIGMLVLVRMKQIEEGRKKIQVPGTQFELQIPTCIGFMESYRKATARYVAKNS